MKDRVKCVFGSFILVAVGFAVPTGCVSVTSAHSVEVQNDSSRPVVIFAKQQYQGQWGDFHNRGQVDPGTTRFVFSMIEPDSDSSDADEYLVEARDLEGKLVKSWEFGYQKRMLLVVRSDNSTG